MKEFIPFPKIPRWSREVIVTEKIDGTNAQVYISDDGTEIMAGSRTRWITPSSDNFGFAQWVQDHEEELFEGLGPGTHTGEWFGSGIQRGYGLKERRFALFNVSKWGDPGSRPRCCDVVPVLWRGNADDANHGIAATLDSLTSEGSRIVPGWMKPEGIVIFHVASGQLFKKLLENDELPKGAVEK